MRTHDRPEPLAEFWSVRVPRRLDGWVPGVADAFADGAWTAAWRGAAGIAPLLALALGLLSMQVIPGLRQFGVYTASLPFMALILTAAILSGPAGALLMAGFVVMDLLGAGSHHFAGAFQRLPLVERWIRLYGSALLSYVLLGLLVIKVPALARRMVDSVALDRFVYASARVPARAALFGVCCGLLVWMWSQATIVLIRPVFTWLKDSPRVEAIQLVQVRWPWLVAVAVAAAVTRVLLEEGLTGRSPRAAVVTALRTQRARDAAAMPARRLPVMAQLVVQVGITTLLLAGAYVGWLDAFIVALVVGPLAAWQGGLFGRLHTRWAVAVSRIPAIIRLVAGVLASYQLAGMITARLWPTGTFRPIMVAALAAFVVFSLLFPRDAMTRDAVREGSEAA